jgi:hypothetical protein
MAIEEDKVEGYAQPLLKASQTAKKLRASAVIVDKDETLEPVPSSERGLGENEAIREDMIAGPTDYTGQPDPH